jgi:hypothetical protein
VGRRPRDDKQISPKYLVDGYRKGDVNDPEAYVIVEAVACCHEDPACEGLELGVICLQGDAPRALVSIERVLRVAGLPLDQAARELGVSPSTIKRWRRQLAKASCVDQPIGAVEG